MIQLSPDSVDWAILHIDKIGDSDLFPRPAELDAVLALRDFTKTLLSTADLVQLIPSAARRFIVPKDNLSFRRATQLNLIDSIILTAIVHQYGNLIEQRRRATHENRVFSYRFKPDQDGWLYDRNFDWTPFWNACSSRASQYSHALVLDISDFYNQIYHHTIENQLSELGLPNQVNKWFLQLLESLTAKVSRGIPVGPHAAHLLAEASLIPIDNSLIAQGIDYIRYVDDIVVFANSGIEARKHLYRIADILDKQQRLVLNKQAYTTSFLSRLSSLLQRNV